MEALRRPGTLNQLSESRIRRDRTIKVAVTGAFEVDANLDHTKHNLVEMQLYQSLNCFWLLLPSEGTSLAADGAATTMEIVPRWDGSTSGLRDNNDALQV
jgi:hypothetical protein